MQDADSTAPTENKRIGVTQAESKRALALIAHLRQVFRTAIIEDGRGRHPLQMDQAELLLCAASLRALLFDDSPSPILIDFIVQHGIDVNLETFETDLAMLFFAQVERSETGHAVDICLGLLFDEEMKRECPLDQEKQLVVVVDGANKAYSSLERNPQVWRPTPEEAAKFNMHVGFSNLGGPVQLCTFKRMRVALSEWGNVRLGYLRGIPIRRRNIICYVANKLGGVHYDSSRLPGKEDRAEFKMLAQAYDWEKQSIMHAGLAAVAIACIEIATHPEIGEILRALQKFEVERRERLLRGESPIWGSELSTVSKK